MTKAGIRNRAIPTTADAANTAGIHGRLRRSNHGSIVSSFLETRRLSRFPYPEGILPCNCPGAARLEEWFGGMVAGQKQSPDPRSRTGALGEAGYRLYCGVK